MNEKNVSIHRELCGPQRGDALLVKRFSSVTRRRRGDGVHEPEANKEDTAMTWCSEPVGVKERGTHRERHTRTWETQAGVRQRTSALQRKQKRVRSSWESDCSILLRGRESRSHGEGSNRVAQPAKET